MDFVVAHPQVQDGEPLGLVDLALTFIGPGIVVDFGWLLPQKRVHGQLIEQLPVPGEIEALDLANVLPAALKASPSEGRQGRPH
jgi:hypothetical protein